jgi:hypothetical protein
VHSVIVFAVLFGWVIEYSTDIGLFPVRCLRHPPPRVVCGEWVTQEDRGVDAGLSGGVQRMRARYKEGIECESEQRRERDS